MLRKMLICHSEIHRWDFVAWPIFLLASHKYLSAFRYRSVASEVAPCLVGLSCFHYLDQLNHFFGSCRALQPGHALPPSWGSRPVPQAPLPSVSYLAEVPPPAPWGTFLVFSLLPLSVTYHKHSVGSVVLFLSHYLYA